MKTLLVMATLLIGMGLGYRMGIVTEHVTDAYAVHSLTGTGYFQILGMRLYIACPSEHSQGAN